MVISVDYTSGPGANADQINVNNGGVLEIRPGGTCTNINLAQHNALVKNSGGNCSNVLLTSAAMLMLTSGNISALTVNSGGIINGFEIPSDTYIDSGVHLSNVRLNTNTQAYLYANNYAENVYINVKNTNSVAKLNILGGTLKNFDINYAKTTLNISSGRNCTKYNMESI